MRWWQRGGVAATLVASVAEVRKGAPGAYYVSADGLELHLRCPCGRCEKFNTLPLAPSRGPYIWHLSGPKDKPSLTPSIHWFEKDATTTHWHGWLREGVFEG